MSKYQKEFISMDGRVFFADVYSVLQAFGVTCPARQHAIKKLLMPGQRGSKGEIQDLDEAMVSVSRAVDMARPRLAEGGTPTGEPEPEPEPGPEPEPKPKLVTWRLCVRIYPYGVHNQHLHARWCCSSNIPKHWYPVECYEQPIATVKKLPKGQKP